MGSLYQVSHVWRHFFWGGKVTFDDCCSCKQMPWTGQFTHFTPLVLSFFELPFDIITLAIGRRGRRWSDPPVGAAGQGSTGESINSGSLLLSLFLCFTLSLSRSLSFSWNLILFALSVIFFSWIGPNCTLTCWKIWRKTMQLLVIRRLLHPPRQPRLKPQLEGVVGVVEPGEEAGPGDAPSAIERYN